MQQGGHVKLKHEKYRAKEEYVVISLLFGHTCTHRIPCFTAYPAVKLEINSSIKTNIFSPNPARQPLQVKSFFCK